jgi:hypothetical protein
MLNVHHLNKKILGLAVGVLALGVVLGLWLWLAVPTALVHKPSDNLNGELVKTYEDVNLGFKFSYPADWVIETESGTLTFSNPKNLSEELNIAVTEARDFSSVAESFAGYTAKPIVVDGMTGTHYFNVSDSFQAVLVEKNGRLYYISGRSDKFIELLSGFKFEQ